MSATNIPTLAIERAPRAGVDLNGHQVMAHRCTAGDHEPADAPDTIILSVGSAGTGSFCTYLTPAMLVHMANELLTDNERRAINVPESGDLIDMEAQRADDAYAQLNDANEAYNEMVLGLRDAGIACAHLYGLKLVHVLVHDGGKQWRKDQRLLCGDCRERLSQAIGSNDFTAPVIADVDHPEWAREPLAIAGGSSE